MDLITYNSLLKKIEAPYKMEKNKLYYIKCGQKREVIPCKIKGKSVLTKEAEETLKKIWYDKDSVGFLSSPMQLYEYTKEKYYGITRSVCIDFVSNQHMYQLKSKSIEHQVLSPIVKMQPNELWCYDLMDMQSYSNYNDRKNFILVVIDHFSKFCWVYPLFSKNRQEKGEIMKYLESLIDKETIPISMLSDNEFRDQQIAKFYKKYGILGRTSQPYTPQQNGAAERVIGTLKKKLKLYMTHTKRYLDILPYIVYNYNNTEHSTTGFKPSVVYRFGTQAIFERVYRNTAKKAEKMKDTIHYKQMNYRDNTEYYKGDLVRINTHALKMKKSKFDNINLYSDEVFEIINSKQIKGNWQYQVQRFMDTSFRPFWNEMQNAVVEGDENMIHPDAYSDLNIDLDIRKATTFIVQDNNFITNTGVNFQKEEGDDFFNEIWLSLIFPHLQVTENQPTTDVIKTIYVFFQKDGTTAESSIRTIKNKNKNKDECILIRLYNANHFEQFREKISHEIPNNWHIYGYVKKKKKDLRWYRSYELLHLKKPPGFGEILVKDNEKASIVIDYSQLYHPENWDSDLTFFYANRQQFLEDIKLMKKDVKDKIIKDIIEYKYQLDHMIKFQKELQDLNETKKRQRKPTKRYDV